MFVVRFVQDRRIRRWRFFTPRTPSVAEPLVDKGYARDGTAVKAEKLATFTINRAHTQQRYNPRLFTHLSRKRFNKRTVMQDLIELLYDWLKKNLNSVFSAIERLLSKTLSN